mgnify:CR=1 FL=1
MLMHLKSPEAAARWLQASRSEWDLAQFDLASTGRARASKKAAALARDLWLARDRARPDYAGRPWLLWSANSARVTEASEEPVEWVVVQK